jgi:hypothetical protein
MANTTHCLVSPATVVEGAPLIQWFNPAGAYVPGAHVYPNAAATVTHADKDTAASLLFHPFVIEHKPRVASTNARTSADSAYATSDQIPVIIGGKRGAIKLVGVFTDQVGNDFAGKRLILGDDGATTVCATANIETGLRLAADVISGDVYTLEWLSA